MKSIESRQRDANEARQLLDNKFLRAAFEGVAEHLESAALACDPDNKDKAARILISKQLLAGIKREIVRVIEDGEVASIQLDEIERKKSLMQRVFTR